ncbi:hypothetical protein NBRC116493_25110 [Aurantivibrio infirmus]
MNEKFFPENKIEELLVKTQEKKIDFKYFIKQFLESEIIMPSATEVMPDGTGVTPLLFDKNSTTMIGIFTSFSRATLYKDKAQYCLSLKGIELVKRIPKGNGVVINPGFSSGFDISPRGILEIAKDFST